ncbi:hypothetical protein GT028_27370 [Streptomyces sp. SID2999]|uniref:hypothetical protein n=1 Tax=Streptomyces sp. SID2999 TaxID=2690258 RepID=UPI0013FF7AA4|nr:hypothetical protein [Streptomyces sp. SID2999]MYZ11051.1 hypothetical protein [Streptomyces sp. SID2999]
MRSGGWSWGRESPCRGWSWKWPRKRSGLEGKADWYTNITGLSHGRSWDPVTRHTFDGVVAGAGNGITVVLLQVGED